MFQLIFFTSSNKPHRNYNRSPEHRLVWLMTEILVGLRQKRKKNDLIIAILNMDFYMSS